ncbi:MAG: hypothetical protein PHZ07_04110 [Patescibacteria group bacterium]|nr:hypothetical protein [Patescibacteria group bacterium]MDD4304496.1 hypothetical protein [Patescibacteria group bacterium]MDD4694856.1 hypothetical protein [Patescibacteria group bacterium]
MDKNINKLFSNLEVFEPNTDLYKKILTNVNSKQKAFARRRFFIFLFLFLGSLIALIPVIKLLYLDFLQSGFFQFFLLIFSDSKVVVKYWQSFVLILLESLPIISVIMFFGVVFVLLESIRFLSKDIRFVFSHNN